MGPSPDSGSRPSPATARLSIALRAHAAGMWLYARALVGARAREALETAVAAARHDLEGDTGKVIDDEGAHLRNAVRREVAARLRSQPDAGCSPAAVLFGATTPCELERDERRALAAHLTGCAACGELMGRALEADRYLRVHRRTAPPDWLVEATLRGEPAPAAVPADASSATPLAPGRTVASEAIGIPRGLRRRRTSAHVPGDCRAGR